MTVLSVNKCRPGPRGRDTVRGVRGQGPCSTRTHATPRHVRPRHARRTTHATHATRIRTVHDLRCVVAATRESLQLPVRELPGERRRELVEVRVARVGAQRVGHVQLVVRRKVVVAQRVDQLRPVVDRGVREPPPQLGGEAGHERADLGGGPREPVRLVAREVARHEDEVGVGQRGLGGVEARQDQRNGRVAPALPEGVVVARGGARRQIAAVAPREGSVAEAAARERGVVVRVQVQVAQVEEAPASSPRRAVHASVVAAVAAGERAAQGEPARVERCGVCRGVWRDG